MAQLGSRPDPLSTSNRLHYVPPALRRTPDIEITVDLTQEEPTEPITKARDTKSDMFTLLSTSYLLLVLAFFKTVLDKLRSRTLDPVKKIQVAPEDDEGNEVNEVLCIPSEIGDISVISVSSEHESGPYDTLLELDSTDDEIDYDVQYGTSLAISKTSRYTPRNTSFYDKQPPYNVDRSFGNALLGPNMDFFGVKQPTDAYDAAVSKFYTFKPVPQSSHTFSDALLLTLPKSVSNFLKDERAAIQKLVTTERKSLVTTVPSLERHQLNQVEQHWRSRLSTTVVSSAYSIDLSVRDLQTLCDGNWLNDNVIDFYLNLVSDLSPQVYCWTTHFFTTLKLKGYQGVARWAKRRKVNVFEKAMVIVPINIMSTHWALAVIDNKKKTISYYDSLSSSGNLNAIRTLQDYMTKEAERLLVPVAQYELRPNVKTPQQQNGYDCGVFTCTVAKYISHGDDLSFSQRDMSTIRRRMAFEIINKGLIGASQNGPHL